MGDGGSGEKTEEPTPERLRKLREDGNVPKSQDVTSAGKFLGVFVVLAGTMPYMCQELLKFFYLAVDLSTTFRDRPPSVVVLFLDLALLCMFKTTIFVLVVDFVLAIVLNVAQIGFLFTMKPITPDLNKINPINGLKNYFNMKKVIELLKTIAKFILTSALAYKAFKEVIRDITLTIRSDLFSAVWIVGKVIWDFCIEIGTIFCIIAVADFLYQRARYMKDNRMSKHDIKQEYKQSEGDPQIKHDRKQMHQELINSPRSAVKSANVVVKNPDHIAIALKYDDSDGSAPTVVAKGTNLQAEKILADAERYGVPVVRNVPLAHALHKLDLGDEIPEDLFTAVAEILTFVHDLAKSQKAKDAGGKKGKK